LLKPEINYKGRDSGTQSGHYHRTMSQIGGWGREIGADRCRFFHFSFKMGKRRKGKGGENFKLKWRRFVF
jgi:hypothetical protein